MAMIYSYRSTDIGAPALTATSGSLIALLDACLVDGYGALTPAGWTKAYTGTNKAAYRMPATDLLGTSDAVIRGYLRVDDSEALHASVRGHESMSSVDDGTRVFPTSGTAIWPKYSVSGGTARGWHLITDGLMVYLRILHVADTNYTAPSIFAFGQYVSLLGAADPSPLLITYADSSSVIKGDGVGRVSSSSFHMLSRMYSGDDAQANFRNYTGASSHSGLIGGWSYGNYDFPYPGRATMGFVGEPLYIFEVIDTNFGARGFWPGLLMPWENLNTLPAGTLIGNVHGAPGRTYEVHKTSFSSASLRSWLTDMTGPWRG